VKTREMARSLPTVFRARPGTVYLEGLVSVTHRGIYGSVVTLDPGGDLSDWADFTWMDRASEKQVRVTTDPKDVGAALLQTLEDRAADYVRPPRASPLCAVVVDPRLVRTVGRVSGVIDADLDGAENPREKRHEFSRADVMAHLVDALHSEGPAAVARKTGLSVSTLSAVARGTTPSSRTIRQYVEALGSVQRGDRTCAWETCEVTITRPNQRYCSRAHVDRAYRGRKISSSPTYDAMISTLDGFDVSVHPRCRRCSAVLLGSAATRGTCRNCESDGD